MNMPNDKDRPRQPSPGKPASAPSSLLAALTPPEARYLGRRGEHWRNKVISTETSSIRRKTAEDAVTALYRSLGAEPPRFVLWMPSPRAGALAAWGLKLLPNLVGPSFRADVLTRPFRNAAAQVRPRVATAVWNQVTSTFAHPPTDGIRKVLLQQFALEVSRPTLFEPLWSVDRAVGSELAMVFGLPAMKMAIDQWTDWEWKHYGMVRGQGPGSAVGPLGPLPQELIGCGRGTFEDAFLPTLRFLEEILSLEDLSLSAIETLSSCGGAWWPFERGIILTDGPIKLNLDVRGRLDSTEGTPAIQYADGFHAHAVRGIHLTPDLLLRGKDLPEGLLEAMGGLSSESFLCEIIGATPILEALQARVVSRSDAGSVHVVEPAEGNSLTLFRIPTLKRRKDGSYKDSLLRLPSEIRSVSAALKWQALQKNGSDSSSDEIQG